MSSAQTLTQASRPVLSQRLGEGLARRARWLALGCTLGLLLPVSSELQPRVGGALGFALELATHLQWFYAALLLVCVCALAALRRDPRWLAAAALAALPWLLASPALPDAVTPARAPEAVLRVASANAWVANPDPARLVQWLRSSGADVAVVLEVSEATASALQALDEFPHRKVLARENPFGIALLSRHRLTDVRVHKLPSGPELIEATLDWNGHPVAVTALHPMPPISVADWRERDRALVQHAERLAARAMPALLAGDLNATPWSSGFAGLQATGLRRATSLAPTWPAALHGLLGIPIDHVLASSHWQQLSSRRGPLLGSDHYPLLVELALAPVTSRADGRQANQGAAAGTKERLRRF